MIRSQSELRAFMRSFAVLVFLFGALACLALMNAAALRAAPAAMTIQNANDQFLEAVMSKNKSKLAALLDADFMWTNANGKTWTRAEVLRDVPALSAADNGGAQSARMYGEVALVQIHAGRDYVVRILAKHPEGWRVLVYQETRLLGTPPRVAPGAGKDCDNPCKTVAYEPKNDAERGVIAAYEALETSAESHNAAVWAGLVADEFLAVSSNADKAFDKKTRLAALEAAKMRGLAPTPLVSARLFDFENAVVMISEHRPDKGKPLHVTRFWVKRNGKWLEIVSYQTTIQGDETKS